MVSLLLGALLTLLEPHMTSHKTQLLYSNIKILKYYFTFDFLKHFFASTTSTLYMLFKRFTGKGNGTTSYLIIKKLKLTTFSAYCALSQILQIEIGIWKNTIQGLLKFQLEFCKKGVMTVHDELEGFLVQIFLYI